MNKKFDELEEFLAIKSHDSYWIRGYKTALKDLIEYLSPEFNTEKKGRSNTVKNNPA